MGQEHVIWGYDTCIDPEFDELGGALTLAQIIDPVPAVETEAYPGQYRRLQNRWSWQEFKQKRHRIDYAAKTLQRAENIILERARSRLKEISIRFVQVRSKEYPTFRFISNPRCNRCIPCNGHHTPDYWGTGQPDCW